ncbi:amino acid adenylation domain-containing protein [Vibrio sp. T187]|uniref:non-ribosomal peptide synthetase n=1 Tax=Vibrio TaxID=662 RepID=UPI0010C9587E|nr:MULTISPECIES: non-ribosomal peptide synthetase [Vibrio]MBW3694980.1 amino acid adenylation domain-containing protein [Vibrio sp. T187]
MSTAKIDKHALAKRFLQLGKPEQVKFIELLQSKGLDFEKLPIVAGAEGEKAPLSPAQKRLWDIYCLDQGNSAYHMSGAFNVVGQLDKVKLESVINQVLQRHQVLRTRFITEQDGETYQHVDLNSVLVPQYTNGLGWSTLQIEEHQRSFVVAPFDLATNLPIRLQCIQTEEHRFKLQIVMHHIVSDGWSIGVFLEELIALYQGSDLPKLDIQYRDYSNWQTALLNAGKGQQHIEYWKQTLGEVTPEKLFPWSGEIKPNQRRRAESISYDLSSVQTQKLNQIARQLSMTSSSLWLGLWQVALAKVTLRSDISVGVPMANRSRHEVSNLIGFFVNTMVVKQSVEPSSTVADVLKSSHDKVIQAQEHQLLPFDQLVNALAIKREAGETPLFQVLFNHQKELAGDIQLGNSLTLSAEEQKGQFALFDVALDIRESESKTRVVLTYAEDRIDTSMMERLNAALELLVESLDRQLNSGVAQVERLSQSEITQLSSLAEPEGDWQFMSIVDLIAKQAESQPNAVSLKHQNNTLSYAQLELASNKLAHQLIETGVKRDEPIGVMFERSCEMIVAMIAVMKAGGAFLPLDPDYPTERLAYMIQDSKAKLVISQADLASRWQRVEGEFESAEIIPRPFWYEEQMRLGTSEDAVDIDLFAEQLAYIIYTSGSTGKPKGVMINHEGLSMHVQTIGHQYGMTPQDTELHFASISFDGAVERWTVPLAFGSKLVIRDQGLWSAEKTCEVLQSESISIACFPPSYVGPLLDWIEQSSTVLSVRSWTLGGEAFTAETYQRLRSVVNPPRIINGYGPTETVVTPMIWRAYPDDILESAYAPIGSPVGERRLYVLDNQLNKVGLGDTGELYIGAEVGLARGYLEQASLTADRFVPDPFVGNGERMYRTGDLVRWNDNGVMEYIGRADQQIKIRGFRVELGEIETQLQAVTQVEHCVVAAHQVGSQKQLFGYLQSSTPERFNLDQIKAELALGLPDYMVPSQIVVLDKLPLTPAGKIDRKGLPLPNASQTRHSEVVVPQTSQEQLLATIWCELLSINEVSCTDNFFALGGDSILCLQMVSKVRVAGFNMTPQQVFDSKNLSELAKRLDIHQQTINKALTTEAFDLMPIQAHFFAQDFAEPNHWNQHVCVELKQAMDTKCLALAIQALVEHHPSLRLSFEHSGEKWQQRYTSFETREYLWQTSVESDEEFQAFAQEVHQSMDIEKGRLIQAGYAEVKGEPSRLILAIHHLAVDGVSWRILLDDLWKAYQQASADQSIQLLPISSTLDETVEALSTWCELRENLSIQDTWHFDVLSEPLAEPALYRDKRTYTSELSNSLTQKLLRSTLPNLGVDIQDVLISTLTSVMTTADSPNLHLYLEGHGREHSVFPELDLSRMVGWTTSLFPVNTQFESDAKTLLNQTAERLSRIKPDGGISYGTRYTNDDWKASDFAQLTFNYLGQYSDDSFAHWCTPIENGGSAQSPMNTMLTPLVVNAQIVSGKLSLSWEFASTHYGDGDIEQLADRYLESLSDFISAQSASKEVHADPKLVELMNQNVTQYDPVFCIHPVTGRVTGYQKLAQKLSGERAVYGIQSKSFVYDNVFDESFSQMADVYFKTIKQIQPKGPYSLVGWSLGGALVQELVARFEQAGDRVAFAGLLDCYVPGTEIAEDQWDSPDAKAKLLEHLSMLLGDLSTEQGDSCLELLNAASPPHWPSAFNAWLDQNNFDSYMAENAKQMLFSWAVEQHMRALCKGYQLPKVNTELYAWWAGQPVGRSNLLSSELTKINTLQVSATIDTDHLGIVQNSEVIEFLNQYLANQ